MKILAIETATEACSVALLVDNKVTTQFEFQPRQHTYLLLPMIEKQLNDAKINLSDLDALAISIGPGSFSGLRIGAGIVQALSFAYELPVILISTLQIIAQTVYDNTAEKNILVLQDAHMGEIYFGKYLVDNEGTMQPEQSDQLLKPSDLPKTKGEWYVAGSAWAVFQSVIEPCIESITTAQSETYPHAESMLKIAKKLFKKKQMGSAANVIPVYLRTADAWRTQ